MQTPCVWTDAVQGHHSTVWSRPLALPYGTEGGQFVLQFDLGAAVQVGRLLKAMFGGYRDIGGMNAKLEIIET